MRKCLILAALLVATPAAAKDITITLNDNEQAQLTALLDLATRQGGIRVAQVASYFDQKLKAAAGPIAAPVTPGPGPKPSDEPKP